MVYNFIEVENSEVLDKFLTRAINTEDIDIRNKIEKFADFYTENLWDCKVEEYA